MLLLVENCCFESEQSEEVEGDSKREVISFMARQNLNGVVMRADITKW